MWHIKSRNLPAITMVVYLQIELINGFVSVIIWGVNDFGDVWKGYGWCDIMVRLQYGTSVGLATCATCILLKLFFIFLANDITVFWFDNKWAQPVTEIVLSIVLPLLIAIFSFFAQPSRYSIFKYTGCVASLGDNTISILVFYFWIIFFSFVDLILSGATLMIFYMKRKAAKDILVCTNSGLSIKRFARLLIFCVIVTILSIVLSSTLGVQMKKLNSTFYSKEETHNPFWGFIFVFDHDKSQDYGRWIVIAISFANFFIFGFGSDAKEMYVNIIKAMGGEGLIKWCEKHLKFLSVAKDESRYAEKLQGSDSNSNGTPSPADTYFTFAQSGKSQNWDAGSSMREFEPAVRSQLLGAELELGKNDNLEELEYLYFN